MEPTGILGYYWALKKTKLFPPKELLSLAPGSAVDTKGAVGDKWMSTVFFVW